MSFLDSLMPADFRASITTPVRRFYWSVLIRCFSRGLTLSLFVVYLHNARGFSVNFATAMLALASVGGLSTGWVWGQLTDRLGPTPTLIIAAVSDAGAVWYWSGVHSHTAAIFGAALLGILTNNDWGAGSTLLTRLIEPDLRQRAFGFNFMLVNLGIGLGSLVSAAVANLHHPKSFTLLYLGDAVITLLATLPVITMWRMGRVDLAHPDRAHLKKEGYREVFRDRRLLWLMGSTLLIMIGGYGSLDAGFSLFMVNNLHLSVHTIGVVFFFNTAMIIAAQLYVINRIDGRSRSGVICVAALLWASFWFILSLSLAIPAFLSIAILCVAIMVFAVGETMMSPVSSAIIADIAPDHLRGRYNSVAGTVWGVTGFIAPLITGLFFDAHVGNWWPGFTGVVAVLGAISILGLRKRLSAQEDGRETPVNP